MKGPATATPAHHLHLELCDNLPAEIDAGTPIEFRVRAFCSSGCELAGYSVTVFDADRIVSSAQLVAHVGQLYEAAFMGIEAPNDIGEHTWNIVLGQSDQTVHGDACLPLIFATKPHTASLAIWDVPSPVVFDSRFRVKIGLKCSAICQLTGAVVEVHDYAGEKVGQGALGHSAWHGTEHLYWADVELMSPASENVFSWTARFAGARSRLPHTDASAMFSFRTARPPDVRVTVVTVSQDTGMPVNDVEVRVGPYQGFSDDSGVAVIDLPQGTYEFTIRKDGFTAEPVTATMSEDVRIEIETLKTLTKAEWEEKLMRFEDYPWG
jgi:hypothetical protein